MHIDLLATRFHKVKAASITFHFFIFSTSATDVPKGTQGLDDSNLIDLVGSTHQRNRALFDWPGLVLAQQVDNGMKLSMQELGQRNSRNPDLESRKSIQSADY